MCETTPMSTAGPNPRRLLFAALGVLTIGLVFLVAALQPARSSLSLTAGDALGHRHEIAGVLRELTEPRGMTLRLVPTSGSEHALDAVERHEIDLALVPGGFEPRASLREIAPLALEPLHVLARAEITSLAELRGRRVSLAPPQSGTRRLALDVLAMIGLGEHDVIEEARTYRELAQRGDEALPDAIFHLSTLPSPIADELIRRHGYHLLDVPLARSLRLRRIAIHEGIIPRAAYGGYPGEPAADLALPATRLVLVSRADLPDQAARTLLETIDSETFAQRAALPRGERPALFDEPELALHTGTLAWLARNEPLITPEWMEGLESLRSFLVSLVVAGILLFRWYRTQRIHGLDGFLAEVSAIDRVVLDLEREAKLDLAKLLVLRNQLGEIKGRALQAFADGNVHSEELLSSFLTHVSDVRSHLHAMILSERQRMQRQARDAGTTADEVMSELWEGALRDPTSSHRAAPPPATESHAPGAREADEDDGA